MSWGFRPALSLTGGSDPGGIMSANQSCYPEVFWAYVNFVVDSVAV